MARMMLDEHRTTRRFWADAISTACYKSNRICLCSILHLTPFELRFGRKSSVSQLRPFGCKCFVLKHDNLDKFESHLLMAFCLNTPLMADLIGCLTLRLTLFSWCLWVCRWQGNGGEHLCRWGTIELRLWWRRTTTCVYIIIQACSCFHTWSRGSSDYYLFHSSSRGIMIWGGDYLWLGSSLSYSEGTSTSINHM
jgi:hypothetical protein